MNTLLKNISITREQNDEISENHIIIAKLTITENKRTAGKRSVSKYMEVSQLEEVFHFF